MTGKWVIRKIPQGSFWAGWWGAFPADSTLPKAVFPTWRRCFDEVAIHITTGKWRP